MKQFSELFNRLESSNKTTAKLNALIDYFKNAPARDGAWAVAYLSGRRPKSPVKSAQIRRWAAEAADIPDWLFEECYDAVGDLAETVSLLLPLEGGGRDLPLTMWIERIQALAKLEEHEKRVHVLSCWEELDQTGRFVFTKLLTGGWRIGVSQRLVTRALGEALGVDTDVLAHRLMGKWQPDENFYENLSRADTSDVDASRPYPFYLAYPLDCPCEDLGEVTDWLVEWKWDGIRAQVIKRESQVFLWSRGEEVITDRFPEIVQAAAGWPDGMVLDGEIVAWKDSVLPFSQLQRRIGRKSVGRKLLAEVPVIFMAYDLLEHEGVDLRQQPTETRRRLLEKLIAELGKTQGADATLLSPVVSAESWAALGEIHNQSRSRNVEGFILKKLDAPYEVGRKRGSWWKWKVDPYSADGVLLYAQRGSGRRANLYTDYTFGVWDGKQLVPFAKAYSGLSDKELAEIDRFVRQNTREKFGPVRSVPPEIVMELHFEAIQTSKRHKSGLAVRFPRIARIRRDKLPQQADSLETLRALLPPGERQENR